MFTTETEGKEISFNTLKWWSSVTMNLALAAMAQSTKPYQHLFIRCALMECSEPLNFAFCQDAVGP